MNVLSLFDGISCGRLALDRAGISYNKYYCSEIDKYALAIAKNNYPNSIFLGDITKWKDWQLPKIDLIIGGSPCQGFSFAGKQLAFNDPRSKLFFNFLDIINYYKPTYFLLENVRMKREHLQTITDFLGVNPICINSSLVSAQNRIRYYWTNIPNIIPPKDKKIVLKDIIENHVDMNLFIDTNYWKRNDLVEYFKKQKQRIIFQPIHTSERGRRLTIDGKKRDDKNGTIVRGYEVRNDGKSCALTTVLKDNYITENYIIRKLTPIECERLQTLPDNWTKGISNSQRYKCLGNAWTVDIITHIFKGIK